MSSFTPKPWLQRSRKTLLVLLALGLAGAGTSCQSARPGYSFQPGPRAVRVAKLPTPREVAAEASPAVEATVSEPAALLRSARKPRWQAAAPALQPAQLPRPTRAVSRGKVRLPVAASVRRLKPEGPAEAGLGTTVLGVLGLVALPVGLLGLALGGGLVWGIIAGLGALAVLVAYLDPDGR